MDVVSDSSINAERYVSRRSVVLFSGGWESSLCLVMAPADAVPVFFDYGQPYAANELAACKRVLALLSRPLLVHLRFPFVARRGRVFVGRNFGFLQTVLYASPAEVWFGCRNPLGWKFDSFGDSNWWFARRMARNYNVPVRTPCVGMPKFLVKYLVRRAGISPGLIYSSEGL